MDTMKKEYNMLREIKRLKSVRGAGTELISIYIPAGYQISDEVAKLREEYSQSSNIKSKTTRSNVQGAIDKILQYLKLYRETPKNGMALFCGNISDVPGKEDIELFSMEPPMPLKVNIYRCDSTFLLEPIESMVEAKDVFVLLVMDGREATIATLKGSHIQVVTKLTSFAHAKVHKGGQSAARYERAIEESINDYRKRIAETINKVFEQSQFKMKGLIIGGPGPAKEGFTKSEHLNYQIKILGIFDTGYTDEYGLSELLGKTSELLKEQESAKDQKILERFIQEVARGGLAVYGYLNTKKVLESNQASTLVLNSEVELYSITYKCSSCGQSINRIEGAESKESTKHECGGILEPVEKKDAIEELIDLADKGGVDTVFVAGESSLGKQFLMGFAGIGALLRYKS